MEEFPEKTEEQPEKKQFSQWLRRSGRKLLPWAMAVCLLALIVVMAVHLLRPKQTPPPPEVPLAKDCSHVYYRKGSALYRAYPGDKPWKIATGLGYDAPQLAQSEDGATLYYLDNITFDGSGSLYSRSLEDHRQKPTRLDTDVTAFSLSEDGALLVYVKGTDLYSHDLQERQLVGRDVTYHCLSADHRRGLYLDQDRTLWQWSYGEEPVSVDTGVTSVVCYDPDLQWSYYRCDDVLYRLDWGKTPQRVSTNVCDVLRTYPDGSLYYMKETLQRINTLDMILEDGENLRMFNLLAGEKMSFYTYSLYLYDGQEETLVGENLAAPAQAPAGDLPVAVYRVCDLGAVEKISLSQVNYVSQVQSLILQALHQASQSYVAVGAHGVMVDTQRINAPTMDETGKWLYYLESQGQSFGKLYRFSLERLDTAVAEPVDDQVHSAYYLAGESAVYFRDAQTTGALYCDEKLLARQVPVEGGVAICPDTGAIAYIFDWNEASASGKLACYQNGSTQILSPAVHAVTFLPGGHLLFLRDYDPEVQLGQLCYYDGNAVTQMDTQVSQMVRLP